MNFMEVSEHLVLMNLCPAMDVVREYGVLSLDDLKKLYDAGIRTCIEYPEWNRIETAQGIYNFSSIEVILTKNRMAGMKTILAVPGPFLPAWIPNEWRYRYSDGAYNTASVSCWNDEASDYQKQFFQKLIEMYKAPDVMFILSEHDTGESMMPSYAFYDNSAKTSFKLRYGDIIEMNFDNQETKTWLEESIITHLLKMQKVFYPQFNEIWDAHQWLIAQKNPASVNYAQPELLKAYRDVFGKDMSLVLLQYTYFDDSHPSENVTYVDMLKNTYNCEVIAEAMFCAGLPVTTPKSIEKGFRGQIVCPTHPHVHQKHLDNNMINAISNSCRQWKESIKK